MAKRSNLERALSPLANAGSSRKRGQERYIPGQYLNAKVFTTKCPRCELIYKRLIPWTGNGMPRYYCPDCQNWISNLEQRYDRTTLEYIRREAIEKAMQTGKWSEYERLIKETEEDNFYDTEV